MWAIFNDPTPGQENVPGNCTWGPSSVPPWGDGWKHSDYWPEGLRNDLSDDWVPPRQQLTKLEQLTALDAEYEPQRIELERYLFRAQNVWQFEIEAERQDTIISILSEMDALELEYNTKAEAIWNG